jgi:hypothetical protein
MPLDTFEEFTGYYRILFLIFGSWPGNIPKLGFQKHKVSLWLSTGAGRRGKTWLRSAGWSKTLRDRATAPAQKTIDLEGRVVKDGVKKALRDQQDALEESWMLSGSSDDWPTKRL